MFNLSRHLDFLVGVPLIQIISVFLNRGRDIIEPQKILIIKLAAMGDSILLIPVLRRLRERFPRARIDWLVTPINESLARNIPYIDKTILWNKKMGRSLIKLILCMREQKYDVVIDGEQWSRGSALLGFLSGAPVRFGFRTPGQFRSGLFTKTYEKRFEDHEIVDFYHLFSLLGPLEKTGNLELPLTKEGREEMSQFDKWFSNGSGKAFRVLIHPGCGADGLPREWPLSSYAVLAHWLIKKYQAQIILTSGPEERKKTFDLKNLLSGEALDLGGQLSWEGLMALVEKCDLIISGNTGIMHVAAALGKKQVALHGPTNSKLWGPINDKARIISTSCPRCPCLKLGFEYHSTDSSCMSMIDVNEVKNAVSSLIDNL